MPTSQHSKVRDLYRSFREQAVVQERAGQLTDAWQSLEAAHIVGQTATSLHVGSHLAMFGLAWRTRNRPEMAGQISRMLGAAIATWAWVPRGNTGRANVSAFRSMPIPDHLQKLLSGPQPPV
jgi:hypothetical protein